MLEHARISVIKGKQQLWLTTPAQRFVYQSRGIDKIEMLLIPVQMAFEEAGADSTTGKYSWKTAIVIDIVIVHYVQVAGTEMPDGDRDKVFC
jgi:hypothetical protein